MADQPTVFVVDDDPGALRSLCWLIQQADLPVRAFRSGREFLESYRPRDVGCLVLDVKMPEMDGLEVQRRLGEQHVRIADHFHYRPRRRAHLCASVQGGSVGFLEKPVDDAVLLDRIRKALARGEERRLQGEFAARMGQLTPAEKEVLDLLISGKSLKEIASVRNVTVQTIWKHRVSILQKMGVESDLELVRIAAQRARQRRE